MRATLLAAIGVAVAAIQPPQRPPVFRAGAHYVRVDAYPARDGRIVEGLTKDDFEILEDGVPQAIDTAEYVVSDVWTPEAERKDPRSRQESYDLAADPRYRIFVIVIDRAAYDMRGMLELRQPLHEFLDRNLGAHDLFGLLETDDSWSDLVLGQTTTAASRQIDDEQWRGPEKIDECGLSLVKGRKHDDNTYALLQGLVDLLSALRQERKSIVFVSDRLSRAGPVAAASGAGALPIPNVGKLGQFKKLQEFCDQERQRLANIDFQARFLELLATARAGNVAFYPVSPAGLQAIGFADHGGADLAAYRKQQEETDNLRSLASETDGVAIVNTNDFTRGMRQVADDLRAYYVLGYYTNNTRWDGKIRSIKVRLKPKLETIRARRQYRAPTTAEIAALSAAAPPAADPSSAAEMKALGSLSVRTSAPFWTYASLGERELTIVLELPADGAGTKGFAGGADIQAFAETARGEPAGSARQKLAAGAHALVMRVPIDPRNTPATVAIRISSGGSLLTDQLAVPPRTALAGDPVAYRNGGPIAFPSCERRDTIRLEWPVIGAVESREARLLDRAGRPLPIALTLSDNERESGRTLTTELALAPLARGEYLIELTANGQGITERKLFALRVN